MKDLAIIFWVAFWALCGAAMWATWGLFSVVRQLAEFAKGGDE